MKLTQLKKSEFYDIINLRSGFYEKRKKENE
jgi:hypothetical protein